MKLTATQLRRIIAEEVSLAKAGDKDSQRFLHGFESGHPMDDEGYMIKSRMTDVKHMAETICGLLENEDQLPAWVQDLVASAHTDLEHVKDYLEGDEEMRSQEAQPEEVWMPVPVEEALVGGASRRMSGGRIEDEMTAGSKMSSKDVKINLLKRDIASQKALIKRVKSSKKNNPDLPAMESRLGDLQSQLQTLKNESFGHRGGMLLEGHTRITPEEMSAWMSGNWGYVSETAEHVRPVTNHKEINAIAGTNAVSTAAMDLGAAEPDEIEFGIGPGPSGPRTAFAGADLSGTMTHYWSDQSGWTALDEPVGLTF